MKAPAITQTIFSFIEYSMGADAICETGLELTDSNAAAIIQNAITSIITNELGANIVQSIKDLEWERDICFIDFIGRIYNGKEYSNKELDEKFYVEIEKSLNVFKKTNSEFFKSLLNNITEINEIINKEKAQAIDSNSILDCQILDLVELIFEQLKLLDELFNICEFWLEFAILEFDAFVKDNKSFHEFLINQNISYFFGNSLLSLLLSSEAFVKRTEEYFFKLYFITSTFCALFKLPGKDISEIRNENFETNLFLYHKLSDSIINPIIYSFKTRNLKLYDHLVDYCNEFDLMKLQELIYFIRNIITERVQKNKSNFKEYLKQIELLYNEMCLKNRTNSIAGP